MIFRKSLILFFSLLLFNGVTTYCQSITGEIQINEQWQSSTIWQWQAEIPAPVISLVTENGIVANRVEIPGLENTAPVGYPLLPVYRKLFNALPDEISFQLQTIDGNVEQITTSIEVFQDTPLDDDAPSSSETAVKAATYTTYPARLVTSDFLGYFKGAPLTRVSIYPCQLLEKGRQLKTCTKMSVQVQIKPGTRLESNGLSGESQVLKSLDITAGAVRRISQAKLAKTTEFFPAGQVLGRITVTEDGIYRLSRKCLADSGINLKNIDPRTFRLYNHDYEVPIFVSGESDGVFNSGDYIEFFGRRNHNSVADYEYDPFSDKNVYWLTWGNEYGLRYAEESAQPTVDLDEAIIPINYLSTAHIEVNGAFHRLGQVDTDLPTYTRDHWFFDDGINGGTTREYTFDLPYPDMNTISNFEVRVAMQGLTYNAGDHRITVYINDIYVAEDAWNGQTAYIIKSDANRILHNNFLKNGQNTLRIAVAGDDPTNLYDKVALDWIEIKYHRLYKATDDCLDFARPEGSLNGLYHFALTNFRSPDISVYKVGKSKLRDFNIIRNSGTGTYSVNLQDYVRDDTTQYWAACGASLKTPVDVQLDTIAGLNSDVDGANIVIITRQEWTNSLQKLTDFYAENNLSAKVIGIRNIYDEFSAGIVTPFAVKKFLQYAYSNWTPAPEYVLLIGDAGLKEEQSIPPYFFQSNKFGACASDFWYSQVDDDEVPDYALGRWPCSTAEELELLVDKRINYTKQNLIGEWNNELLLIAGTQTDNPDVFRNQSENMIQRQIGKEFNINRIYINPASEGTRFFGGSEQLISLFNKGIALGDFMGHGGGAVWADRSLFNSSHIKQLDNLDRLPFLTSLTCFTADFTNVTGLGEMMILAENGGAIGLWGATSVGWIKSDYLLAKPFYDVIFESGMTVGKAIQIAKIRYLTEQSNLDYLKSSMLNSYNLIGDPTVALPFPQESVLLSLDKTNPAAGDTVNLSGTLPFTEGEMAIQLYDSSKYSIYPEPLSVSFNSSTFSQQIILPDTINSGNTFINYYLKSSTGTSDAHGVTLFDIQGLTFYGFKCTPSLPSRNVPISLTINTELSDIQSIFCEVDTVSAYEYLDEDGIEHVVSFQIDSLLMQIPLAAVSGITTQWRTAQSFSIGTPGKLIAVRFIAINSGGNRTVSQSYLINIKKAPDFYPVSIGQGGTRFPEIIAHIYYLGDDTLRTKVKVERLDNGLSAGTFGEGLYTFLPNRTTAIGFPGFPGKGSASYKVTVDSDLQIAESSESNNSLTQSLEINTFAVLPGLGTTFYGIQNDTIRVAGIFYVVISPLSVSDSAVLILKPDTTLTISGQPKFSLISPSSEYSRFGLNAVWGSGLNPSDQSISLKIDLTECAETNRTDLTIGKWNPTLRIWYEEESGAAGNSLTAVTNLPGKFSLIRNSDTNPPSLELNLDGQQFFQNSYVSDRPSISIIGEDDNGVRFDKEGIVVYIDDNQVGFESLSTPDTVTDGHYIAIQFRPELSEGNHTLSATLKDAAGNSTTEIVDFIVSDRLKLIDYGNFPNPFKTQTTFIYELTQRTTVLKIKIYTGSGRLIRTLESSDIYTAGPDLNEGGYHEVTWDGLDEDGNYVANGVYFYKIYARRGSKTVSKTGKLAKTR